MKQSLGPMTITINLAMQTDRTYQRAWKQTFVNTFKLIPVVNEIAEVLAGSKQQNDALMNMLGDISLFGTTRLSNKATFPVSILLSVAAKNEQYAKEVPNTAITPNMIRKTIDEIDFSGAGAYNLWIDACDITFSMRRGATTTGRVLREALFHAVWGTQKEGLGLLNWMTGHNFQTRREMGDQFQERGTHGTANIALIRFKRICKLASASQTLSYWWKRTNK